VGDKDFEEEAGDDVFAGVTGDGDDFEIASGVAMEGGGDFGFGASEFLHGFIV